ncbi:hypothetical protein VitviT2T_006523 [Vitis vinifera]|nr:hypothetical protein VitviT2T_006523 [Vitis vinifera]
MAEERSETRDSCYFPGCRKDANCNCEMCLDSISATLDLLPASIQRSTLTKLSAPKTVERTPVSFNSSVMSTPESGTSKTSLSPAVRSTARVSLEQKMKKRKRVWRFGLYFWRLVVGVGLIFAAEFGFSWGVSRVLRPELSWDIVRSVGERSWVVKDLNEKVGFLQNQLQGFVGGEVSNCSYIDSTWEVSQDGLLLNSRCTLYKSVTEEVTIWGWPLQTAGLLATGLSSRSFTILSGRVTEWPDGRIRNLLRKANSSWTHKKWSASVVQLDPNTLVLEYRRSSILESSRLFSAALEFLRFWMCRMVERMKQEFWVLSVFEIKYSDFTAKESDRIPT